MIHPFPDILSLFHTIELPQHPSKDELRFSVVSIPGYRQSLLGKSMADQPCLLLRTSHSQHPSRQRAITLENLFIRIDADCALLRHDSPGETNQFTVIQCTSTDISLQDLFLKIMVPFVAEFERDNSAENINRTVDELLALFNSLSSPAIKSIRGLWSELFLIDHSSDPELLVKCWHSKPGDRFDFAQGEYRIEVKGTSGRIRRHTFSLDQLVAAPNMEVKVVSLRVDRSVGGASIGNLVDRIVSRVRDFDALHHFHRTIVQTIGNDWRRLEDERFDLQMANGSMRIYDAERIPKVPTPLPKEVSSVRFESDLTSINSIIVQSLAGSPSSLFQSISNPETA